MELRGDSGKQGSIALLEGSHGILPHRRFRRESHQRDSPVGIRQSSPAIKPDSAKRQERKGIVVADVNLGVIGLGRMGRIFSRHLARHSGGGRLASVSSRAIEAADEVAQQGRDVQIYSNYQDLLNDDEIDGVVIATLTNTHRDIVVAAAQAGKAIFCEKPLALTLVETDTMLAAVESAGVLLQVGFMRRFDKGYVEAKRQIVDGVIGHPIVAHAVSRDPACPNTDWAAPTSSGGLILDLAIHDFDILRWLMDDEVRRVHTEGGVLSCPDLEEIDDIDSALINLRFSDGGLGNVEAARNCGYGYDIRCEIRGTEGTLQIGYLRDTPVVSLTQQGATHDIVAWFENRFTPAYNAQLDHFVECVQENKAPAVGAQDARLAQQICMAAAQSYREGRPVNVADLD